MRVTRRVCTTTTAAAAATMRSSSGGGAFAKDESLLGYPLRRAAACELLYGGVRVQHLVQRPFALHRIRSEDLPSPSLQRERDDVGLEMQLPRDLQGYGNVHMGVQRLIGNGAPEFAPGDDDDNDDVVREMSSDGFDLSSFMAAHHHPNRQYTSSLPYNAHDTNNVLALRLLPINVNIRARTEVAQLRTRDCLDRLRDGKMCAQAGAPLRYPLSLTQRHRYTQQQQAATQETLYSPAADNPHKPAAITTQQQQQQQQHNAANGTAAATALRYAHLHGGPHHPPSSRLSIVTRPVDVVRSSGVGDGVDDDVDDDVAVTRHGVRAHYGVHPRLPRRYWQPLQVLKPLGSVWSPALRGAGTRSPRDELYQERLDRKGFGWKRKSRSLWQQDIHTHGFRPNRYY